MNFKKIVTSLISLFFPEICVICNNNLVEGEEFVCLHCLCKLPKTNYHLHLSNPSEERFRGKFPYEKVSSFLFYNKGGISQKVIVEIKYKGNKKFGTWMGAYMANEIIGTGFFNDIDILVPVPLHKKRLKSRGFNQSEEIVNGISQITGIPVNADSLYRGIENISQTKKNVFDRWQNTQNIFMMKEPDIFAGKHVLLIDDVLTTGSTIEACANRLLTCKETSVSILTLALTQ